MSMDLKNKKTSHCEEPQATKQSRVPKAGSPRLLRSLAMTMLVLFAVSGGAFAQKMDMSKVVDPPSFMDEMPGAKFEEESEPYEEVPPKDPFLAYRMRLPFGWYKVDEDYEAAETTMGRDIAITQEEEAIRRELDGDAPVDTGGGVNSLSQRVLVKVATYFAPFNVGKASSRFEIRALKLERDITAKNWLLQFILSNGYILQGLKEYSDGKVEALYALNEGDYSFYVRSVAEINGPRITIASYFLPDVLWEKERAIQEHVVKSFRFTSPDKTKIELSRTYAFFDVVEFDYPSSWRLQAPNVYSVEGMDAKLTHTLDQKTLAGEINIHIVSTELDTTLAQEVNVLKEEISELGLKIGDMIETPNKFKFREHIYFNRIEVYTANNRRQNLVDYEYWLAVMAESRYYYIVTMLTPGRKSDFYQWAQNTEAFEAVIESFRPGGS